MQLGIFRVFRVMRIVILANESLKAELMESVNDLQGEIVWVDTVMKLQEHTGADVWIDLLFDKEHLAILQHFLPRTVIINSVDETLRETDSSFVRINGWPTFLRSRIIEASCLVAEKKPATETAFSLFNKTIQWLPDEPGFVTPRVISMVINEAFISLKEGVSTEDEIDIAIKLGTNYPYGPFEWSNKIGIGNVNSLLQKLSATQKRYTPFIL